MKKHYTTKLYKTHSSGTTLTRDVVAEPASEYSEIENARSSLDGSQPSDGPRADYYEIIDSETGCVVEAGDHG